MMRKFALARLAQGLLGLAATVSTAAYAAQPPASSGCGISGSATAAPAIYDPFAAGNTQVTNVALTLARINGGGGEKTDIVNLYLTDASGRSNGVQVIPRTTAVAGQVLGLGNDIFYGADETPPTVSPTSIDPTLRMHSSRSSLPATTRIPIRRSSISTC